MIKGNVLGLYGGPACGKSTLAARLYTTLKQQHIDVEYVNEYAKEMVYQENSLALQDQLLLFAHQYHKVWTACKHNDLVITDSPILLGPIYNIESSPTFNALVMEYHNKFNNLSILLKRVDRFHSMSGRIHTLTESISIDNRIKQLLDNEGIEYLEFDATKDSVDALIKLIKQEFAL